MERANMERANMERANKAIAAHKASIAAAMASDKQGWLALFADDAIIHDPVGESPHDPEGRGFQGAARREEFWDTMIGPVKVNIEPHKRIAVGEHICAVHMTAVTTIGEDTCISIEMMAVYEVNESGRLLSLNAYWDLDSVQA